MAATSEATKEYMVNPISVGIRLIGMKLGEDVDLEASYKINYFWPRSEAVWFLTSEATKEYMVKAIYVMLTSRPATK